MIDPDSINAAVAPVAGSEIRGDLWAPTPAAHYWDSRREVDERRQDVQRAVV